LKKIAKDSILIALFSDGSKNQNERVLAFNSLIIDKNIIYMPLNIREDVFAFTLNGLKKSQIVMVDLCDKYRTIAMKYVSKVSRESLDVGFIDSVKIINGELEGFTTFGKAVSNLIDKNDKIAIFGSNGRVKSILHHIKDLSKVSIIEKDIELLREISREFKHVDIIWADENRKVSISGYSKFINCSDKSIEKLPIKDFDEVKIISENDIFLEQAKIDLEVLNL